MEGEGGREGEGRKEGAMEEKRWSERGESGRDRGERGKGRKGREGGGRKTSLHPHNIYKVITSLIFSEVIIVHCIYLLILESGPNRPAADQGDFADMLSGTKIVGQLRKNSSGHATRIFAKKSRKFEIPAVRLKGLLQSCTCVSLTHIKNINITRHLIPLSRLPN